MPSQLMADGITLLCDKCDQYPARYYVSGLTYLSLYDGLCPKCCQEYLLSIGDTVGAAKFIGQ